jgi:hypothetical protein
VLTAIFLVVGRPNPRELLREWADERGHGRYGQQSLREALPTIPVRWLRPVNAPHIAIDIKFRHMQQLYAKRAEAIEKRRLIQGADDFVPASIRFEGRTIPVELRLKGDFTDHLHGNKWSFRIHVRGNEQIFGLRRFSIQHPATRNYHGEALFFEHLRSLEVLAPRYFFVRVTVNGDDVGVMAVEEHFSKELLESQGRRESVIVRFDESVFWDDNLIRLQSGRGDLPFNTYLNATIDAFRSTRVAESPSLSADYELAVGLLRAFVAGDLSAPEVFDVETMGRFLAVAELWDAPHTLYWNNLRLYLNPFTLKLEPIAFDAEVSGRPSPDALASQHEPFVRVLLSNSDIFAVFKRTLNDLADDLASGQLQARLSDIEAQQLPILQKEFYFLQPYPFPQLSQRADRLAPLDRDDFLRKPAPADTYPTLIHAYVIDGQEGRYLEVVNAVPHEVVVTSGRWIAGDTLADFKPVDASSEQLPLRLAPRRMHSPPQSRRIYYEPPASTGGYLELTSHIQGQERTYRTAAASYFAPATSPPIPRSSIDDQLDRHSFLDADRQAKTIHVRPGTWEVRESIVVPAGFRFVLPAGTTLRFATRSALISRGPLVFEGTANAPVRLEALDNTESGGWPGILVLEAEEASRWTHVTIANTRGLQPLGWQLTGSVTFYKSDIDIDSCLFFGNQAEDALNIVRSHFDFEELRIVNATSDGLDVDFAQGRLSHGRFEDIGLVGGGDAVDFSGSVATVEGTRFRTIGDKAISVGESSQVTVRGVSVDGAIAGAVVKDGSRLDLSESDLRNLEHAGLMAYIKKPEYGPAALVAERLTFGGSFIRARAQTGSRISIDGADVDTEEIDVERLYDTIMRRGVTR